MPEAGGRYSRQVRFAPIGEQGQRRLAAARVTVVGCGALGGLAAAHLVRAGVGRLRIVDRDFVEESNLQRQILFVQEDAERFLPKAAAAAAHLRRANPEIVVEERIADLTWRNAAGLIGSPDLIVDGTDNFETRFLLNDYAVREGIPWIYGACVGSYGIALTVVPGTTPCLRCVMPESPEPGSTPTCDRDGILGPVAGWIASHQAAEALKILTGHADRICTDLVTVDVWENRLARVRAGRDDFSRSCRCCGERRFEYLEGREGAWEHALCGRDSVQVTPPPGAAIDLAGLEEKLRSAGRVERNRFLLRFHLADRVLTVFPDGRAIVSGTTDPAAARSLYARFVGS